MSEQKYLTGITLTEFRNMEYKLPEKPFTSVVIVPMLKKHESGFQTMKFILTHGNEIVGVVGGGSDIVCLNGIGGYGKYGTEFDKVRDTGMTKRIAWSLECLPKSKCIRLFSDYEFELDDFIGSTFCVYATKPIMEKRK